MFKLTDLQSQVRTWVRWVSGNLQWGFLFGLLLSGCAKTSSISETPLIPANRIIEKTVTLPPPELSMTYRLEEGNNPGLLKAYQQFIKNGAANTIETEQFVQFPYNAGVQPIVAANVFELTVISLENGEQVTSVSCGDPTRWSYSLAYSGANPSRQAHVMLKPAKANISTDFFITTDRRAYTLKLLSSDNGKYVREVRFWYPQLIQANWQQQNQQLNQPERIVAELPDVDIEHLNFDYQLTPTRPIPAWLPQRIFDDGIHTYIQLNHHVNSNDLPVLFVKNGNTQEMVNYRFKHPYFVIDKIFKQAILISGVGRQQQRVKILNQHDPYAS